MNDMQGIYGFLGLCARARGLVSGETAVLKAVREGKAKLVIIASDASVQTGKRFTDKCGFYSIEAVTYGTRTDLGHAIGTAPKSAVAVCDSGFAAELNRRLRGGLEVHGKAESEGTGGRTGSEKQGCHRLPAGTGRGKRKKL